MSISLEIEKEVRRLLDERYKRTEIAKKMNLRQSQISILLNGDRPWGGLRLDTVDRMFPDAVIHLYGEKPSVIVGDNSAVAVNHSNATNNAGVDRSRLMSAVLALDIDDSAKIKVLKMLEGF